MILPAQCLNHKFDFACEYIVTEDKTACEETSEKLGRPPVMMLLCNCLKIPVLKTTHQALYQLSLYLKIPEAVLLQLTKNHTLVCPLHLWSCPVKQSSPSSCQIFLFFPNGYKINFLNWLVLNIQLQCVYTLLPGLPYNCSVHSRPNLSPQGLCKLAKVFHSSFGNDGLSDKQLVVNGFHHKFHPQISVMACHSYKWRLITNGTQLQVTGIALYEVNMELWSASYSSQTYLPVQ